MVKLYPQPIHERKETCASREGLADWEGGLEVARPPLSVTAGPRTGQDVAENAAWKGSCHLLASSRNTGKEGLEGQAQGGLCPASAG